MPQVILTTNLLVEIKKQKRMKNKTKKASSKKQILLKSLHFLNQLVKLNVDLNAPCVLTVKTEQDDLMKILFRVTVNVKLQMSSKFYYFFTSVLD